jgi:signal transduction histidine kinase
MIKGMDPKSAEPSSLELLAMSEDALQQMRSTNRAVVGLSIARTIVETYGGKILAENRAGGGAVFRFMLSLIQQSAPRDWLASGQIG